MKVIFISSAENIHTIRWVNGLVKRGIEIYLISLKNHHNNYSLNKLDKKVRVIYLPISGFKGYYLNSFFINRIIKKLNPDIVNVHYASGYGTLGRFVKFDKKLLNVWGSDIYDFPNENIIKKKILIKNLNSFKYIASTSYCMAEETKKYLKNKNQEIFITPFGVDLNRFKNKFYDYSKKNSTKIIIGAIKALKEIYGIEYLIKSIKKLELLVNKEDFEKIEVRIYGDGELKNHLIKLTKDLNLEKKIIFSERITNSEVALKLNELDIFVIPSLRESFGVVAIEAMACEVPVIASDAEGLKEIISDGKTGLIFKRKNSLELANKLKLLIENIKIRKIIAKNGRKEVEEKYDWNKNVSNLIKIYKTIKESKVENGKKVKYIR